jgi:serine/threonine protein kinase
MLIKIDTLEFNDDTSCKGLYEMKTFEGTFGTFPCKIKKLDKKFVENDRLIKEKVIRLGHGNLVRIFDVKLHQGHIYVVMDSFQVPLKDFFKINEELTEIDLTKIMSDVTKGLTHLHSKGLHHHRLQPETIIICEHSKEAKISDYMILKGCIVSDKDVS